MSLSELLTQIQYGQRQSCTTCEWLESLPEKDAQTFGAWIESGRPVSALHEACKLMEPPVPVEYTAFRRHVKRCP